MANSLKRRASPLASATHQLRVLNTGELSDLPKFGEVLHARGCGELRPGPIEIFQVNVGKMCNQTCRHCHVDAGPDRKEIMTRATMEQCLEVLRAHRFRTVDITGGAPEMNPDFRWFVAELRPLVSTLMVRSNLTIITAAEKYRDLPDFFAGHRVTVVSSLPYYQKSFTDRQRGEGVFEASITALRLLNGAGYGSGEGLELDLVYNPCGAFFPAAQAELESDFKRELAREFGIRFDKLYTITNLPISRFLEYLIESGNLREYMEKLVASFNPAAAAGVMCRNTLSVGWDGAVYDCDFNQMLELPVQCERSRHIGDFDLGDLERRKICIDQHCFGCTAGAGSSCGGAIT